MAPKKKKGNRKGDDDWEAEIGEPAPVAVADAAKDDSNGTAKGADVDTTAKNSAAADGSDDEEDVGGGGLMRLMRKNKAKRKKKGLTEDYVDGELAEGYQHNKDVQAGDGAAAVEGDESLFSPEIATPVAAAKQDDVEEEKPAHGKKGGKGGAKADKAVDTADDGRLLTKAEKEKLKKEIEKQRKKEVSFCFLFFVLVSWWRRGVRYFKIYAPDVY